MLTLLKSEGSAMENYITYFVFAIFCAATVNAIQWKDCGSAGSQVVSVAVSGCESAKICPLAKGQNGTISVTFKTSEDFSKATAIVHGILAQVPVPFPIPNPDGCSNSGLTCPVTSGSNVVYSSQIFIKSAYPKVRVVVKWELVDENNKDIFCVELPAEVVDGVKVNGRR